MTARSSRFSGPKSRANLICLLKEELRAHINEISANMIADLIQEGIIADCTDTDDETEFKVQDIINERLAEFFGLDYEEIQE